MRPSRRFRLSSRLFFRIFASSLALLALSSGIETPARAAPPDKALSITVREGQTLRDIAQEYFNDPNLWREILRFNDLEAAESVQPGAVLSIPRNEVSLANAALIASLDAIQSATEAGARVFAAEALESAVQQRSQGLALRQASDWVGCRRVALEARASAEQALRVTEAQRNASAQAMLNQQTGSVQSRKTSELVWKRTAKGSILEEKEKVRTLSDSTAEILFLDESRIQLVPNSQAVIQKLRVDKLKGQQKASVSLVEGDAFALLASAGNGRGVDVEVPGISTDGFSTDFWVSRQGKQSKFANYDEEQMQITSGGETVTLAKNQGTIVEDGRSPSTVRDLLPAPALLAPEDDQIQFADKETVLSWEAVEGAVHYHLEAAADADFGQIVFRRSRHPATEASPEQLEDGLYYWRVSAVDDLGFPGAKSRARRFRVLVSTGAPFLALEAPADGAILRTSPLVVEGRAPARGELFVGGEAVPLRADGGFRVELALTEGENSLVFEARDESGKSHELTRHLVYMPDRPARIVFDPELPRSHPRRFLSREPTILLSGTTLAKARVEAKGTSIATYADETGRFELSLPLGESLADQEVTLEVTAPSGFTTTEDLVVSRDLRPPELRLLEAPPSRTSAASVQLKGQAAGAIRLELNGEAVRLRDDLFEETVELQPGSNRLELVAIDEVGNETRQLRTIQRDSDPPRLVSARASARKVRGGETVEITVSAEDASGLKRFAIVLVVVGDWRENVSLRLDPDGAYRSAVRIPRPVEGSLVLKHVTLEDYLGNKKSYSPN